MTSVKFYFIEGNIGVGKSTFIYWLKQNIIKKDNTEYIFIEEPLQIFEKNFNNEDTFLSYYYKNQEKTYIPFQQLVMLSYKTIYEKILSLIKFNFDKNIVFIAERSPYSIYYMFTKMLMNKYNCNKYNKKVFKLMFINFFNWLDLYPKTFIKLNCPYNLMLLRIKLRNRFGEENISINYLEDLNKYLTKFLRFNFTVIDTDSSCSYNIDILNLF